MNFILALLLVVCTGVSVADSYVVNTSHILYVKKSEDIRAFIEPGTILKKLNIPTEDTYRRRLRVVTPGGLEGEISKWGYDEHKNITTPIAYLKRPLTIKNEQFESGNAFLAIPTDDDDGLQYEVAYPQPYLSLKDNAYYVKKRTKSMTDAEFEYNFNLINPGQVSTKFPFWAQSTNSPVEWGCEKSKKEVSIIEVGAGAKASAGGSFFNFFEADAYVNNDNKKTITYTKDLVDNKNKHKITYWKLKSSPASSTYILTLALEKRKRSVNPI